MGGGDIKLLAMIGAFLGWKAVLPVIFFSSLIGSLVGVPLMLVEKGRWQARHPFWTIFGARGSDLPVMGQCSGPLVSLLF